MKDRIKIDSAALSLFIILTGFLYHFRHLYSSNIFLDDIFDFIGIWVVLAGTLFRMAARSHKKNHSAQGHQLVKSGPYDLSRNPMYLGSFLMGLGFILMVWPWWSVLIFAFLFYQRFNVQILKEEKHLGKVFGKSYDDYVRKVPRIFPSLSRLKRFNFKKDFPRDELFETKETGGLIAWPVLAFFLELFQEHLIFGTVDVLKTLVIIVSSWGSFMLLLWSAYSKNNAQNPKLI